MFYFFLFLMIVLAVIVFSDVVVYTDYAENKFSTKVKFFGITVFDSNKPKKEQQSGSKSGEKHKFSFEILKKYLDIIGKLLPDIKKTVRYFKRKIKCPNLEFDMQFGLADAAECGIANGLIWAVEGQIFVVLNEFIEFKNPKIMITPLFNNMDSVSIRYKGIYKLKIYHIIIIGIYFVKIYNKYKNLKGGVLNG